MKLKEKYKLRHIRGNIICPICGKLISDKDDIIITECKYKRSIARNFYHSDCCDGTIRRQLHYYAEHITGGRYYE